MPGSDDASGDLPVTGSVVVLASVLSWRFSRSSGPGGQGVNTADSRVELFPNCTRLAAHNDEEPAGWRALHSH
jgi:protein subunit release factor B